MEANCPPETDSTGEIDALFRCLAHTRRRVTLRVLDSSDTRRLSTADLATKVASEELDQTDSTLRGSQPSQESHAEDSPAADSIRRTRTTLEHRHLPQLTDVGLIQYDSQRSTVSPAEHPAWADSGVRECIYTEGDPTSLDQLFDALADSCRRTVLDVLSHQRHPIHIETLAREVYAKHFGVSENKLAPSAVGEMLTKLHHFHLPKLADAELITIDDTEETIEFAGNEYLRIPWVHSALESQFQENLVSGSATGEVKTIEGREEILSYGQYLGERADDELLCLIAQTDMLDAGYIDRIRSALERDVDIVIGTHDPMIREFLAETLPAVTLLDPPVNWVGGPIEADSVGRIVLADRETVLVGTVPAGNSAASAGEEKAMIGEGRQNPLTILVRQYLSSQLQETGDVAKNNSKSSAR